MFGRKKRFSKYKRFYRRGPKVGEEFEHNGQIYKVLAKEGEQLISDGIGGGYINDILYCEHQCTVIERLQAEVKELKELVMKEFINEEGTTKQITTTEEF